MSRFGLPALNLAADDLGESVPANVEVIRSVIEQGEQALASARATGDQRAEVGALIDLGSALARSGQAAKGAAYLGEAVAAARAVGDPARERDALSSLGWTTLVLGEVSRGLELLDESLRLARSAGDRVDEKTTLYRLGNAWYLFARDPARAAVHYGSALALARELSDWQHEVEILWCLAITDADSGRTDQAVARASAAVELLISRNHPHATWFADNLRQFRTGGRDAALAHSDALLAGAAGRPQPGVVGLGVLGRALSAVKAVSKYLGSGLKSVPPKIQRQRLEVCAPCEYHTGARCRVCGCFTALKAWLPYETCPLGKWPSEV